MAGVGLLVARLQGNITTSEIRVSEVDVPDSSKGVNILVLGSDSRDSESASFGTNTGTQRSDSMLLVHLSADNQRIDAVQIPRDTVIQLPACEDTGSGAYAGGRGMINSALNYGPACSVAAVEALTDVHVNHFIMLDFEGFISIVDAMDGIKVCLATPLVDSKAKLDLPAGQQTLGGYDALALARTRHAIGDGSDIARLGNQQMVMSAIVQRATSKEVLSRPDRLYSFLDATTSSMTVDRGLSSIADLTSLAARVQAVPTDQITFMTMPNQPAPENPNRVVPSEDAYVIFDRIAQGNPVKLTTDKPTEDTAEASSPDATLPFTIVNGARVNGLAAQFAQSAADQGFTNSSITTAATAADKTQLLIPDDVDAQKFATALAQALELKIKPVASDVETTQLILGQDYLSLVKTPEKEVKATSRNANQSLCG
ncbi:LCP family protein [Glutamicibacter sp. NPDC087344]|uniref:LCP family protein n=1 Tax=Glutamicibacter sp. NPDC087344 TaxID=3363994 RepID=UPI0038218865